MHSSDLIFSIFLIFTGAALLATAALYARQALLVAYIVVGALLGPSALGLVDDAGFIAEIAEIGIIFLLFLLGLNLYPQKLIQLLRETTIVVVASSVVFASVGYAFATALGLPPTDRIVVAIALLFSSTIVGLKLLPTTVLHHRHTGEIIISVLLLQDLIAIVALLTLHGLAEGGVPLLKVGLLLGALPVLAVSAFVLQKWVLQRLLARFDRIQEYIFLLVIGWCLGIAQAAQALGLSYEIGAFVAGVAVATSPISRFIAETLKPLRDFFLVLFFFALGASIDLASVDRMLIYAVALAVAVMVVKPVTFRALLGFAGEKHTLSWEAGFRLGQLSEFSLLIVFVASQSALISPDAASLVQISTILTFVFSSYIVVLRYPTPIAISDHLRRD